MLCSEGLVVDYESQRLYWVNSDSHTIQFFDLLTNGTTTVPLPEGANPTALAIYLNTLYYADQDYSAIHSADKTSGTNHLIVRNNTGKSALHYILIFKVI